MTRNQLEYLRLLETERSNKAVEQQTALRDSRTYALGVRSQDEVERANRERELFNRDSLRETGRHNQAVESHNLAQLQESMRHNLSTENMSAITNQLRLQELDEVRRTNLARETENRRHNLAAEVEAYRSSVARETENTRHNLATERVASGQLNVDRQRAAEIARSNKANEGLQSQRNAISSAELSALNSYRGAQLSLSQRQQDEVVRSNVAKENETRAHNLATETETARHNQVMETQGYWSTGADVAVKASRVFGTIIAAGGM